MKKSVRIYHNPRCSKSLQSRQLLDDNGITTEVIDYLEHPPGVNELAEILDMLGLEPRDLMRKHETPYQELALDNVTLTRVELIEAMVNYPILIERPIVIHGNKAVIGRPPEKILEIL